MKNYLSAFKVMLGISVFFIDYYAQGAGLEKSFLEEEHRFTWEQTSQLSQATYFPDHRSLVSQQGIMSNTEKQEWFLQGFSPVLNLSVTDALFREDSLPYYEEGLYGHGLPLGTTHFSEPEKDVPDAFVPIDKRKVEEDMDKRTLFPVVMYATPGRWVGQRDWAMQGAVQAIKRGERGVVQSIPWEERGTVQPSRISVPRASVPRLGDYVQHSLPSRHEILPPQRGIDSSAKKEENTVLPEQKEINKNPLGKKAKRGFYVTKKIQDFLRVHLHTRSLDECLGLLVNRSMISEKALQDQGFKKNIEEHIKIERTKKEQMERLIK